MRSLRAVAGLVALGFALSVGSTPSSADSITNGSFETPTVPAAGFTNFGTGSTLITGWTVVGPQVSIVSGTFTQNGIAFPAEDGSQWLDLTGDGSNANEGVEQVIATTAGTAYTVSFWVGNVDNPGGIFGTSSTVAVLVNGSLLGTFTNGNSTTGTQTWDQFSTHFTAIGATSTVEFVNQDPAGDNSNGLDNITVNPTGGTGPIPTTPEPATLSLLGAGLFGLLLRRKLA